jgi:hypothetical protein
MNSLLNGGFPPLVLINKNKECNNKKNNNKECNNKERNIASKIKNNINIRNILQTNNNKDILEIYNKNKTDELDIINSL